MQVAPEPHGQGIILYTTSACHLCELAEALLTEAGVEAPEVEKVDISESDSLVERYGVRIPVLQRRADGEELGWPFDLTQLVGFLAVNERG